MVLPAVFLIRPDFSNGLGRKNPVRNATFVKKEIMDDPARQASLRKIIHVDMDAFYASVEQRDDPALRGKPVAVGTGQERGVVAAASYEARRYGVRSAMSCLRAKELCPGITFVPGRMDVYKSVSAQIHAIFHEYTDLVEPLSLDEAFLDVTDNKKNVVLAVDIARQIKQRIRESLSLVASAGVSYNKFLAKIASDYRKPDGLCTIHPSRAQWFIDRLPVESFWGVGKVTARRMKSLGIRTGRDMRECSLEFLTRNFGKQGQVYYDFSRGRDDRAVQPVRIRKSVGCEHTLDRDITTLSDIVIELYHVITDLEGRIERSGFRGSTLTLKIKFSDFTVRSKSVSVKYDIVACEEILPLAKKLMAQAQEEWAGQAIRLLGLTVSNPAEEGPVYYVRQLSFDF